MSALGRHVAEYLVLRRSFGFKLEREEQLLAHFVAYVEAAGEEHLTGDLAIAWAKLPTTASANHWAKRLSAVRSFAAYLVTMDPATEVPPSGIFPTTRCRPTPYLFSEPDIVRVLAAAGRLTPPLRAATHEALFGLLAACGMRIGEAISLARGDVDLESGVITIRHTKFDRTRLVPLHQSTTAALSVYAATRDRLCPRPPADVFFCSSIGTPLNRSGVGKTFRQITGARASHRDDTSTGARSPAWFCRPHARQLAAAGSEHRRPPRDPVWLSWSRCALRHLLVPVGRSRADDIGRRPARGALRESAMSTLAPSLEAFFTDRLVGQRAASQNTIAAYALTFRLLLEFTSARTGTPPSRLDIAHIDAPLVAAFLEHLERERGNTAATPNARLAAIHSLFSYLALHHPEHAGTIGRVLSIPHKQTEVNLVTYLNEDEAAALLAACDQRRRTGRRDHTMFALTIQTGLRISELVGLNCADVTLGRGANVHTFGKGRKERRTPLVASTVEILNAFLAERAAAPNEPLFATSTGRRLSRDAIEHRLAHHVALAEMTCPSLEAKRITMHTLRHTAAMRLLLAGNDVTIIALWLGHEQLATTNIYLHADMSHKQEAIDRVTPLPAKPGRYRPSDSRRLPRNPPRTQRRMAS